MNRVYQLKGNFAESYHGLLMSTFVSITKKKKNFFFFKPITDAVNGSKIIQGSVNMSISVWLENKQLLELKSSKRELVIPKP